MALEAVLRERLGAVALDDEAAHAPPLLGDPAPVDCAPGAARCGAGSAVDRAGRPDDASPPTCAAATPRWQPVLDEWLRGVSRGGGCRRPLRPPRRAGAGRMLGRAAADRSLSRNGLSFYAPDERTHGVIERQREIDELASAARRPGSESWRRARSAAARGAKRPLARHREAVNTRPAQRPGPAAAAARGPGRGDSS
ncbi:MAG: hypothetical protein MZW92_78300 [Comamonadaceae bacterium]|nr:hypothetical protein [Comamonadaceae bacterium]